MLYEQTLEQWYQATKPHVPDELLRNMCAFTDDVETLNNAVVEVIGQLAFQLGEPSKAGGPTDNTVSTILYGVTRIMDLNKTLVKLAGEADHELSVRKQNKKADKAAHNVNENKGGEQ